MCQQCQTKPVYEFTNKRKVCGNCFVKWFQKKVFYTIRKFSMLKKGDVVGYSKKNDFRSVVLENVLEMLGENKIIKIAKLPSRLYLQIYDSSINAEKGFSANKISMKKSGEADFVVINNRAKRGQINKLATPLTTDLISYKIIKEIIKGNSKNLKDTMPVNGKIISPLYLFLDKEILLYAKLKKLKFKRLSLLNSQSTNSKSGFPNLLEKGFSANKISMKKSGEADFVVINNRAKRGKTNLDKISTFIDKLEKKHPEIKRAIVNGYLNNL